MRIAICDVWFPLLLMAPTGPETDDPAIRAVMDRFMDAALESSRGQGRFAAIFSEDADFTNWRGAGTSGRAKREEFHAPMFATIFSKSHREYTEIKTRFICPDVAAVDLRWKMTGAIDGQGNLRPEQEGLLSLVMANRAGLWEIEVMHNLDLSAPPPPAKRGRVFASGVS